MAKILFVTLAISICTLASASHGFVIPRPAAPPPNIPRPNISAPRPTVPRKSVVVPGCSVSVQRPNVSIQHWPTRGPTQTARPQLATPPPPAPVQNRVAPQPTSPQGPTPSERAERTPPPQYRCSGAEAGLSRAGWVASPIGRGRINLTNASPSMTGGFSLPGRQSGEARSSSSGNNGATDGRSLVYGSQGASGSNSGAGVPIGRDSAGGASDGVANSSGKGGTTTPGGRINLANAPPSMKGAFSSNGGAGRADGGVGSAAGVLSPSSRTAPSAEGRVAVE